jgi:hypothetical protein
MRKAEKDPRLGWGETQLRSTPVDPESSTDCLRQHETALGIDSYLLLSGHHSPSMRMED